MWSKLQSFFTLLGAVFGAIGAILRFLVRAQRQLREWLWILLRPLLHRLLAPSCRYEVQTSKGIRQAWDFYPLVLGLFTLLLLLIVLYIPYFVFSEEGRRYRAAAASVHPTKEITDKPLRGSILARDERPVAVTMPVYRLALDFRANSLEPLYKPIPQGKGRQDSLDRVKYFELRAELDYGLDRLAVVLDSLVDFKAHGLDAQQLKRRWREGFTQKRRGMPLLNLDISYQQYQTLMASSPFAPKLIGRAKTPKKSLMTSLLSLEPRTKRIYPFGSLAYRTIGQLQPAGEEGLSKGNSGLELKYNQYLRGHMGTSLQVYYGGGYRTITQQPPLDGADIVTNLDMDIQSIVEHALRDQLEQLEAQSGTVVLMEVKTGKIVSISNLERLSRGGYGESINMAMTNKAEPGSTFKVASMMVALDDGIIHPNDTIDVGNGLWAHAGRVVRDHNADKGGYGRISAAQTIIKSSNVGVAKIITKGYHDKPDVYVQKIRDLGFGLDFQKLVDLQGVERATIRKRSDNPNRWYGTTLAWMSYGYETQIPPIYTLAFFNAIANGGRYMRPYFVSEIRHKDSLSTYFYPQVLKEQICKPQTLVEIQSMLRRVVTEGTGKKARSPYVAISGKSGTAQLSGVRGYRDSLGYVRHQVSFCAYFPSEAPRYSCIAVIRAPSPRYSAGGGVMAAPIIRRIAEQLIALEAPRSLDSLRRSASPLAYRQQLAAGRSATQLQLLAQLGLPTPQLPHPVPRYMRLDSLGKVYPLRVQAGHMPDLRGMSAMDAVYLLRSLGYRVRPLGAGNVLSQSVPAGTALAAGAEVVLQLGYDA